MKKIAKKIFGILIFVLLCFAIFLGYQFIQYKNQEVDEVKREVQAESDAKLQEELLNHEIEKAENFVENINNDVNDDTKGTKTVNNSSANFDISAKIW